MNWIYSLKCWAFMFSMIFVNGIQAQNPNWNAPNSSEFNFSANAISTIYLNDIKSDNPGDRIAFFSGNELRGLSEPVDLGGQEYLHFITIYSNESGDTMSIKVYHQDTDLVYDLAIHFEFEPQKISGSVDTPMPLNIYDDNDAPIYLTDIPLQTTLEGLSFNEIDMLNYLVQVDSQAVIWSYTPNPNLTVSFNGNLLQVEGVPNFNGLTTLTVRATELPVTTLLKEARSGSSSSRAQPVAHFAETTIEFFVTPGYLGPAWNTIPGQGIEIGNQFSPVNLHDYEYQYGGPAIQYDYIPLITVSDTPVPKPTWTFSGNFQTNMNVIARVDYTPKYQFHNEDDFLAVYVNDEIRGTATRDSISGLYFISISGTAIENDSVAIKFYSGAMKQEFELEDLFNYEAHQIIGSVANPYVLEFAPIVPVIVDVPIAGGNYVMPVNIVDTTYLGIEYFRFYAFDPEYPEYLIDSTETSFCIVSDSSELVMLYRDMDGDGLGDPNNLITSCAGSPGFVDNGDDCDDTNPVDPTFTVSIMENSAGTANDDFVCANDTVILTASGGTAYEWSNGETMATITVLPSYESAYSVTATAGSGCKGVAIADLQVEGKIVTTSNNAGHGSLRSVLSCLIEGDTITYDQPTIEFSNITASLIIDKDVNISGQDFIMRPEVRLDFSTMSYGFEIFANKNLNIENLDLKIINVNTKPTFTGPGSLNILGLTEIKQ